ncbi:MAG: aldehyde-activating protein, partial [Candidatus Poseidoniia archaeon]|nr:aldehyde-activating protein [Candidatus Poseidoniia archaeon]
MTQHHRGRCHCGNIRVLFESEKTAQALAVRACGCSFCRGHGARTTTDAEGSAEIEVADASRLSRYRFGLKTADFLICGNCGAYMGALFEDDDG